MLVNLLLARAATKVIDILLARTAPKVLKVLRERVSCRSHCNILAMDSTSTLKSITPGQQNCKVFGRLLRLWDAVNMKSKFPDPLISIDGVLLDEEGTLVQISVLKKFHKQCRPLLTEGNVYMFTDTSAVDIKNKSHIYQHQSYMLQFKQSTKVHQLQTRGADIPKFSFNFCPLDKLPEKDTFVKSLQDIIGVISHVGPFDYASSTSQHKLRIIKIRNLDEQTQEIRLWGQHGETFDEETVLQKSQEGIVVGIFAGLTVGSFLGMTQVSSTSATKVYIDLDIPEVKTFRNSYQWESPPLKQQQPEVIHLSPLQAAGKLYTLEEISTMPPSSFQEGSTYSVIAKVQSIVTSAKWYYIGCKRCDKGYNNNTDTPTCPCMNSSPKPMYKLPITLTDASGNLDAIAFSSVAEQLVERDAFQASQNMKIDPMEHVAALDTAIGKTKLFHLGMKVDSSSRFPISYVIKKSFSVDDENHPEDSDKTPSSIHPQTMINADKQQKSNFDAKRRLFTDNKNKDVALPAENLNLQAVKRPRQNIADNSVASIMQDGQEDDHNKN